MLAKSTDYGLPMTDPSVLRVANTPETKFLIQAELRAIQQGLKYIEKENDYYGYVNQHGQYEGVGIYILPSFCKTYGEWLLGKLHGCGKDVYDDGGIYWGEYKNGKYEGYGTWHNNKGSKYIG
jgi:hypothetical protein